MTLTLAPVWETDDRCWRLRSLVAEQRQDLNQALRCINRHRRLGPCLDVRRIAAIGSAAMCKVTLGEIVESAKLANVVFGSAIAEKVISRRR